MTQLAASTQSTEPAFARTLVFDRDETFVDRWTGAIRERDLGVVRAVIEGLKETDSGLFPGGLGVDDLTERGLDYLCFRTHLLRYTSSPKQIERNRADLAAVIGMALAVSGHRVLLPTTALAGARCLLVDGSNLLLDLRRLTSRCVVIFDGESGSVTVAQTEAAARFDADRVRISSLNGGIALSLPADNDFVFFFRESETLDGEGRERRLLEESHMSELGNLLRETQRYLHAACPGVWASIRQHVVCLSFTSLVDTESSTDTRDGRGAIVVNPRTQLIDSEHESVAWMAQGLYHEAKHVQFFDTYRARCPPHADMTDPRATPLSSTTPRIPCSWKGTPSLRSMADHLLALQAFIPGYIVAFRRLTLRPHTALSSWIRQHIEMDMRAINGAMGCLMLGERYFTDDGRALASAIRRDYVELLLPAYQALAS